MLDASAASIVMVGAALPPKVLLTVELDGKVLCSIAFVLSFQTRTFELELFPVIVLTCKAAALTVDVDKDRAESFPEPS